MTSTSDPHGHGHHRFQAHHFDTGEQQFQAGKLGMWLFLATEVLFFSGMFCAYAVYRSNHPEIFANSSQYLDTWLGAFNTLILLASSLSVAWAVRCAQLNNSAGIVYNLVFTLVCAGVFMGVKSVEYTLKFYEGLWWRSKYVPQIPGQHHDLTQAYADLQNFGLVTLAVGVALVILGYLLAGRNPAGRWTFWALGGSVLGIAVGCLGGNIYTQSKMSHGHTASHGHSDVDHHEAGHDDSSHHAANPPETSTTVPTETTPGDAPATTGGEGSDEADAADVDDAVPTAINPVPLAGDHGADVAQMPPPVVVTPEGPVEFDGLGRKFPGIFFSIYYAMTGVHAVHILIGIGVIVWIVARAAAGHFGSDYYGPVEYVGLYWHLVDLIWIYLFPLLYLI